MSEEKRRFQRMSAEEIVQVQILSYPSPDGAAEFLREPFYLKAKNLSEEGICLETTDFYVPNQIFKLEFSSLNNARVETYAEVVWSERNECGLKFIRAGEFLKRLMQKVSA